METKVSREYVIGILSVILIVVFWVGSGFLTQKILEDYSKPFFMCYITNLTYMIYFIFFFIPDPAQKLATERPIPKLEDSDEKPQELPPLSMGEMAKIAFVFFILYLASNYATNFAFGATSVGSASILAATCGFFTLTFGWMLGVEVMSLMRIVSVLISVGGVVFLGIPEFSGKDNRALGNALALAGAVLYGIYSTFLKRVAIDESRIKMPILFAFGGLYTLLFAWPILLILHYYGIEPFELPPNRTITTYLIINVVFGGLIPNYLWNIAYVCTSPLVVALGTAFNIPLTLVVEWILDVPFPWYRAVAGIFIVAGFCVLNFANIYPQMDLAAERFLAKIGIMNSGDIKDSDERAARLRTKLIEKAREN